MPVVIAMLRGVNVGGHNIIKMEALRTLCASLKLRDACTYVQSGNVIFGTEEKKLDLLATRLQERIAKDFGFRPDVILRTTEDLRKVIARNPFAKRRGLEPAKLHVFFLASDPGLKLREQVMAIKTEPEELRCSEREIYVYFPNGMGQSKMSWPKIERALKTSATGRNWNSVTKMLEMAEKLEVSA
jgi:uncharacterized protein (DUF1697 family)